MTTPASTTMAAAFSIACLTPTDIVPPRAYLTIIQKVLNSNAMRIASATSNTYGNLVQTVTPITYATGANDFQAPINPFLNSKYTAYTSSGTIHEATRRQIIRRTHYDTYHAADKVLRKLLLDKISAIYLKAIKYGTLGFGKCTSFDILDHLWDTNWIINHDQLAVNLENIKTPWQPLTPIEKNLHLAEDMPGLFDAGEWCNRRRIEY